MSYIEDNMKQGKEDRWVKNGVGTKNELYACGMLSKNGCTLTANDKPLACLLYPVTINQNGTMVLHNRCTTAKGVCKGNFNEGPMVIDVLRDTFVHLFGQAQYSRVRINIIAGVDSYFEVPDLVWYQYHEEKIHEQNNTQPVPRSTVRLPTNG
jgi:Fe-S-cluster containining protein